MVTRLAMLVRLSACTGILLATSCGRAGVDGTPAHVAAGGPEHELIGEPAPPFTAPLADGSGNVALADYEGKVVVVDFWATWCEPCKKAFPKLEALRAKHEARGLVIVAISEDDENVGIDEFGQAYGARFPLVWDKDKAIASAWHPPSMPSSFVVDKKGVVRFVHFGYHEGEEQEIEQEVKSLL